MFRIDRASVGIRGGEALTLPLRPESSPQNPETSPPEFDAETELTIEGETPDESETTPPPPQETPEEVLSKAREQAAAILRKAENEARGIVQQAHIQCDSIKNEAWQEGSLRGREEGEAAAKALCAEEANLLATVIERIAGMRASVIEDIERDVVRLSLDIAQKILSIELDRNDEAFMGIVKGALAALKAEGKVVLRVSPAEYARFFEGGTTALSLSSETVKITAVKDEGAEPFGCVMDAENGSINAGVLTQLRAAAQALA